MPLSFGAVYCAALVTGKDLDSEEDHMKQMDKMTIPLMTANFLQLSLRTMCPCWAGMEFKELSMN